MNKKWYLYFSSLLLSFGFVSAQKGPFSIFGGGGSGGLIGSFERGVNALVGLIGRNPAIPVFFMVFSIIYYLSRKTVFKEESGRNPAMIFSLAVAGIGLIPTFGLVGFISEAIGGGFLGLMALFALFFWGWTWFNSLRATQLESSAEKAKAGEGAIRAGISRDSASHDRWKGGREREREGAEIGEVDRRDRGERGERNALRGMINNTIRIISDTEQNTENPQRRDRDLNRLRASLNQIRSNIIHNFPQRIREIDDGYHLLITVIQTNDQRQIRNALNRIRTVLIRLLEELRNIPQRP